jgi:hypothetical protein
MDGSQMDKAKDYRSRASELRKIAKGLYDVEERKTLLVVVADYERLARSFAKET